MIKAYLELNDDHFEVLYPNFLEGHVNNSLSKIRGSSN
jgi:hypothetical protein